MRTAIRDPLKKAFRLRTDHQCASGQREKQTDLFSGRMKWHALFSSLMVLKLPERRVEADGPGDVLGGTLESEFNCPWQPEVMLDLEGRGVDGKNTDQLSVSIQHR